MSDLFQLSANQLSQKIKAKEISAVEVAEAFLQRISKVNPKINALIQSNPEQVLQQAHQKDQELAAGKPLGRLHGVPFSSKNHCQVAGFSSDYGSYLLANQKKSQMNATVISRFLNEGAILLELALHVLAGPDGLDLYCQLVSTQSSAQVNISKLKITWLNPVTIPGAYLKTPYKNSRMLALSSLR